MTDNSYDLVIMSDLVFNHTQHNALLDTCKRYMENDAVVLVFFTHHRPWLREKDLDIFEKAKNAGFRVEKIGDVRYDVMFPEDPGDAELRATVHQYQLRLE